MDEPFAGVDPIAVDHSQGKIVEAKEPVVERPKERARKFTFKEQKEYEEIDAVIAGVENEIKVVATRMNTCGSDFTLLQS